MSEQPIRLLLVEDHALMRMGLKGQFSLESDFEVIGEAENGQQAIDLATQLQPNIVLMDIELPILDGISATQKIKSDLSRYPSSGPKRLWQRQSSGWHARRWSRWVLLKKY